MSHILFKPCQVKTRPKQMFQDNYDRVFPAPNVSTINYLLYLIPIKIDVKLSKKIRYIQRNKLEYDNYRKTLLSYGKFHLGCFILQSLLGNNYNEKKIIDNSEKIITDIEDDTIFDKHYQTALDNFVKILKKFAGQRKESIPSALRKTDLDKRIVKYIKTGK